MNQMSNFKWCPSSISPSGVERSHHFISFLQKLNSDFGFQTSVSHKISTCVMFVYSLLSPSQLRGNCMKTWNYPHL